MGRRQDSEPIEDEPQGRDTEVAVPHALAASSRKLIGIIFVALVVVALLQLTSLSDSLSYVTDLEQGPLAGRGGMAMLWFVLLTAGLMAMGVPRLVFYVLGGLAFDFWLGLLLAVTGSMIGSFVAFRLARWVGRDWLKQRFWRKKMFSRLASTRPSATAVAMVRMLPISNFLLNVGLSLSRVRNRDFLLGTLLGFLPQGVVATLVGSGVGEDSLIGATSYIGAACVIVLALSVWSARKLRARKHSGKGPSSL